MSAAIRVLVAEDDTALSLDLQLRLQQLGYAVCGTTDRADDAIVRSRELHPDVALMDIRLGGETDGVEAACVIHDECNIPVVFLAAHSDLRAVQRAQQRLPFGYVVQPCDSRALHGALQLALERGSGDGPRPSEVVSHSKRMFPIPHDRSEALANMSHELRTPLNSMLTLSRILANNDEHNLSARQVEYAQVIHAAGLDLLERIDDVLDLVKIETDNLEIEVDSIAIAELCEEAQCMFGGLAAHKGLAFRVSLATELPRIVRSDRRRLWQIMRKLLDNAFKFTHSGEVRLELAQAGSDLAIGVADTGIGIEPGQLERVFEAFYQADGSVSRRYRGCGLGLTLCRELARRLGGRIEGQSTPGEGSRFTLFVPLQPRHSIEAEPSRNEARSEVA